MAYEDLGAQAEEYLTRRRTMSAAGIPGAPQRVYPRAALSEAFYYDGSPDRAVAIVHWAGGKIRKHGGVLQVETANGDVVEAYNGDWVIQAQDGALAVCPGAEFVGTYQQEN